MGRVSGAHPVSRATTTLLRPGVEEPLGVAAMVVFGVVTVTQAHSTVLRILCGVVWVLGEVGLLVARHRAGRSRLVGLLVAVVCGLVATIASPSGAGELLTLVGGGRLPPAVPERLRTPVIGVFSALFGVSVAVAAHTWVGLFAALGGVLLGQRTMARMALQAERDRAVALLAEVQASRDAQAAAAAGAARTRIAREMHDVLAHSLAGLSLQLQAVRAVAVREGVGESVTVPLDRAAELAREGVAEARAAVGALDGGSSAGSVAGQDVDAVAGLVERFPGSATLAVTGPRGRLDPAAGHAVYRAVQESLTNAARYAPGAPVTVQLDWGPAGLDVTVRDPGAERPVELPAESSGRGLAGMAERLSACGGRLQAGADGAGWAVRCWVPCAP